VNPRTLEFDETGNRVLIGQTSLLPKGILVENTFEHYIGEIPHSHAPVQRIWQYHSKSHTFSAGRLIRDD
jgi:hypothetical protein